MPTNLTDISEFTSPVAVPSDGDARNAASVETSFQALANRTKYNKDLLEPFDVRHVVLTPAGASKGFAPAAADDGEHGWQDAHDGADRGATESLRTFSRLYWELRGMIPAGAVIQTIEAMVTPGATANVGFRMKIELWSTIPDWSTPSDGVPAFVFTEEDPNSGATIRVISKTGINHTVLEGERLHLHLSARTENNDAFSGNWGASDVCHAVRITFVDPGPRSY